MKQVVKKPKANIRPPTQDELMERALDMEEGNVVQHRDYLLLEEEKRKRARVIRAPIEGPLLKWVSRVEEVSVEEDLPPEPSTNSQINYPHQSWQQAPGSQFVVNFQQPYTPQYPQSSASQAQQYSVWYGGGAYPSQTSASVPLSSPEPPRFRQEKIAKNYVVIECQQHDSAPLPTWKETMEAMFGDHVKWEEVRVYVGKNRPMCE